MYLSGTTLKILGTQNKTNTEIHMDKTYSSSSNSPAQYLCDSFMSTEVTVHGLAIPMTDYLLKG